MVLIRGGASSATSIQSKTTAQRVALSPSAGDVVYDSDLIMVFYYDGSTWVSM